MYNGKSAILWQGSFITNLKESEEEVVSRRSLVVSHSPGDRGRELDDKTLTTDDCFRNVRGESKGEWYEEIHDRAGDPESRDSGGGTIAGSRGQVQPGAAPAGTGYSVAGIVCYCQQRCTVCIWPQMRRSSSGTPNSAV